jgi:hypothetical protein
VQELALVDDHVSVALWPTEMLAGFALRVTVGIGGVDATVT